MKTHVGVRPQGVIWNGLAAASCAGGLAFGLGSAAVAGASANAAASTGCKPKAGAAIRTLRLTFPGHTVSGDVGDTIKVIAHVKGDQVGVPKPFGPGAHAVCRISVHRLSASEVIAKFRALGARKVSFEAVASKDGHAPLIVGYVKIESSRGFV